MTNEFNFRGVRSNQALEIKVNAFIKDCVIKRDVEWSSGVIALYSWIKNRKLLSVDEKDLLYSAIEKVFSNFNIDFSDVKE